MFATNSTHFCTARKVVRGRPVVYRLRKGQCEHCTRMEGPDSRVDLFFCFHPEMLSAGFTTSELVTATEELVRTSYNKQGTEPFIFAGSMARRVEMADAVLQTRPGGLAIFLVTPTFFTNSLCIAVLEAFFQVCTDSNMNLKVRFVCLEWTLDDILSSSSMNRQELDISMFGRCQDVIVTSIQATSVDLCDIVFSAWECTDGFISPNSLPTVLGRTRQESFLALQQLFTEDDLPMFRTKLRLPPEARNMPDAFGYASRRGAVTEHDVKRLYGFINYRKSPDAEEQRGMVKGYERKWVDSKRLSWEGKVREDMVRVFENKQRRVSQASSSRPQINFRETDTVMQGNRSPQTTICDIGSLPGTR